MSSRDEIAKLLFDNHYHEMPKTRYYDMQDAEDEADQILALIEGQRCEWVMTRYSGLNAYTISCRGEPLVDYETFLPFCPCCGRKIEVKDEG